MTEEKVTGSTEQIVQIKKVSELEPIEMPLAEFLKVVLSGLPITDSINDEIRLANGEVFIPSSLQVISKNLDKSEEESSSNSTTTAGF